MAGIVDISDEKQPRLISLLPLPEPPPESGLKNFYEKAGRFGPHNHHHPNHQACLEDRDDIAYLTYFNAGLRVYDIRDARQPKEIAYFVPADPKTRIGTKPTKLVAQSEDVLVDRRGCIYLSDKNHGIHVLRLQKIWPIGHAARTKKRSRTWRRFCARWEPPKLLRRHRPGKYFDAPQTLTVSV